MNGSKTNSQTFNKKNPLTPVQKEKVYQIIKQGFLMRLERKGILPPSKKKPH